MTAQTFDDVTPQSDASDDIVAAYTEAVLAATDGTRDAPMDADTDLETVAARLAANEPDSPDVVYEELLDQLLIEMTTAVVDVERLASQLQLDIGAKELQQRIEGRAPMTLREYALIRHTIVAGQ